MSILDFMPPQVKIIETLLNPKVWGTVVVLSGISYGAYRLHHTGYEDGVKDGSGSVQSKWDKERTAQFAEKAASDKLYREKERKGVENFAKIQNEKEAAINDLSTQLAASLAKLRDRPKRPVGPVSPVASGLPGNSSTETRSTGAELYREDAEFLAREAARADKVRIALGVCYKQYNEARNITNN